MAIAFIKPDGTGDFTTLQAWVTATSGLSGTRDAECTGAVGALTISSWTPSSTRIYPAAGQKHFLDLTGANMGAVSISIGGTAISIDGMRITGTLGITNCSPTVKNSIVSGATTVTPAGPGPIAPQFTNSVLLGGFSTTSSAGATINPTFANCFVASGLNWAPSGGTINLTARNTMADTFATTGGLGTITMANNLSADASADDWGGSGHLINKPLANQVENVASVWRLKSTADARDAGTTVAAATPDAVGTSRPRGTAYDIGPHEFWIKTTNRVSVGVGIGV